MQWLQTNRKAEMVYDFYRFAKTVNAGFYDSAFEFLFHHTVKEYHRTHTIELLMSDNSEYLKLELLVEKVICSGNEQTTCHELLRSVSTTLYWYPNYGYLPFIDCVCHCRLVHKTGHTEEAFGCIQITTAGTKTFRRQRMQELQAIKEKNPSFCDYEAIYVVVTPSEDACNSFVLVVDEEMNDTDYDLSDYSDECPAEAAELQDPAENKNLLVAVENKGFVILEEKEESIGDQVEISMPRRCEAVTNWKQVITYFDPDSVQIDDLDDCKHLVPKNIALHQSKKKKRQTR
jgi:hypothetical protein